MPSLTETAWNPPAAALVTVVHLPSQQTASGVHQQRHEGGHIPKDEAPRHPQVMTMSVRHRTRRFNHEAADLFRTI